MARVSSQFDSLQLLNLKSLIEVNYGASVVNATDCLKISALIAKGKHGNISSQTLRRFFGLVNSEFNPSIATLNVLSQYCGYEDWEHFYKKSIHSDTFFKDIVEVCVAFFAIEIPPVKKNQLNEPYFYAVQNIAKLIYGDVNLYNRVIPTLAQNKTAHEYFFERFPFIDKLCCGFSVGYKIYLQNKKNPEALIFGNSLLFLGSFLEEDLDLAAKYLSEINKIKDWKHIQLHPFVLARIIGSNIVYNHVLDNITKKNEWLMELEHTLNDSPNRFGHNINSCEFEFMICEYLLLAECYDLVKTLMAHVLKGFKHEPLENKANFYYIPCHVLYYKALIMTDDYKTAKKIPYINEPVNWQIKDYYELHLVQCRLKTSKNKVSKNMAAKQYYHLLNLTRFSYFNKLIV